MRVLKEEIKTILASGKFRSDFFKHAGVEKSSGEKIIEDYLHRMACGLGVRKPMPGFQPTIYASLQTSDGEAKTDPFVDFLRKGLPEGPWLQRVIQDGGKQKASASGKARVALHVARILSGPVARHRRAAESQCLRSGPFYQRRYARRGGARRARPPAYRGRLVDLQITPNLGRDIGPFLTQFGRVLCRDYDIVGPSAHEEKPARDRSAVC